jgi:hypothetical protein
VRFTSWYWPQHARGDRSRGTAYGRPDADFQSPSLRELRQIGTDLGLHNPLHPSFHFDWDRKAGEPTATVCAVCDKLVTVLRVPGETYPASRLVHELYTHAIEEFEREGAQWTLLLSSSHTSQTSI